LPPNSGATESERTVTAGSEAGSVDGTSLGGLIKLELVVGGDVTSAAGAVNQLAVGESDGESISTL